MFPGGARKLHVDWRFCIFLGRFLGKVRGCILRGDLHLCVGLRPRVVLKRVLVPPVGFVPKDSADRVGVVFDRHNGHREAVAEIKKRHAAADRMRVVESRVTNAEIDIELANALFVARKDRAKGALDRHGVRLSNLVAQKVRRLRLPLEAFHGAGKLLPHRVKNGGRGRF